MRSARRLYVHHWEFGTWGREKKTKNKRPRANRRACTPTAIQALGAEQEFQAPAVQQGSATSGPDGVRSTSGSLIKISSPPSARRRSGGGPAAAPPRPRLCWETPANSQSCHTVSACFSPLSKLCTSLRLNSFSTLAAAATRTAVATRLVTGLLGETGGDGGRRARIPQVQSHR